MLPPKKELEATTSHKQQGIASKLSKIKAENISIGVLYLKVSKYKHNDEVV